MTKAIFYLLKRFERRGLLIVEDCSEIDFNSHILVCSYVRKVLVCSNNISAILVKVVFIIELWAPLWSCTLANQNSVTLQTSRLEGELQIKGGTNTAYVSNTTLIISVLRDLSKLFLWKTIVNRKNSSLSPRESGNYCEKIVRENILVEIYLHRKYNFLRSYSHEQNYFKLEILNINL